MLKRLGSLLLSVVLMSAFVFTATIKHAHAYIEIGSATLMLQMLLASGIGGLFAIRMYWRRIVSTMSRVVARVKSPRGSID